MGAWLTYGLGTDNQSLPGFVVLHGGRVPSGGMQCFTSGFPGKLPGFNRSSRICSAIQCDSKREPGRSAIQKAEVPQPD